MKIQIEWRHWPFWRQIAFISLLGLFLFGLLMAVNFQFPAKLIPYANRDFMTLWAGGRSIVEGIDPYDPSAWRELRERFGSTWIPDQRAPFPLWTFLFFIPWAILPVNLAAALWLTISQLLLGLSLFLLLSKIARKTITLSEYTLILLGALFFRGTAVTFLHGQLTILLLFIPVMFLYLLSKRLPFLAGFVLACILIKPTAFFLFGPVIGVWLLLRRQWRAIAGGLIGVAGLVLGTWLIQPGWINEWLHVRGKTFVTFQTPTVWGLAYEISPEWWLWIGIGVTILVTAGLAWMVARYKEINVFEVTSLALAGSLLVTPYAWAYEHTLLLLPMTLIFSRINRRYAAIFAWLALTLIIPWSLFGIAVQRRLDTLSFTVPLLTSLACLCCIPFVRKMISRGVRAIRIYE
jgi:hypothetical protein